MQNKLLEIKRNDMFNMIKCIIRYLDEEEEKECKTN